MSTSRTRELVMDYLRTHGPVTDSAGHATAVLKGAVAESASPMAFTQLIAALARSGHVVREVRGKRTFAIAAAQRASTTTEATDPASDDGAATLDNRAAALENGASARTLAGAAPARTPRVRRGTRPTVHDAPQTARADAHTPVASETLASSAPLPGAVVDADEVAAALLAQVTKMLTDPDANQAAGWMRRRVSKLEAQVTELEQALAKARAEARQLAEQRDELQAQVDRAEQNLTVLSQRLDHAPRRGHSRAQRRLGPAEQALLLQLQRQRPEHVG